MDGFDSLPDEDVAQSPNGDEPARSGVQPETGVEHLWNATPGCLYAGVETNAPATSIRASKAPNSLITAVANSISTQARPIADSTVRPRCWIHWPLARHARLGVGDQERRVTMHTFAQKPKACQQTTFLKSALADRTHLAQTHTVN